MIITGLRGVGKTALLGEFRSIADSKDWAVVEIEVSKHDDDQFRIQLAQQVRRALFTLAPKARWRERMQNAARILKSFTFSVDPDGNFTAGLDLERLEGLGDSGDLATDLTDLFVALGEAASEAQRGVVFLLDEVQFLSREQFEALIAALHKTVQRSLPMTLTAAGLPQIPELAGDAKSYAERLFKFPEIGSLDRREAYQALQQPATDEGVDYAADALNAAYEFTEGYPYFLQEFGQSVWTLADGPVITGEDASNALRDVESVLDESFFRVRHDRTTELELSYLRAMAELGPEPHKADAVAEAMGRTSQQCGPVRSGLISKGLLYTPQHGFAAFTVPQFDRYLKRRIPTFEPPPVKKRKNKKK